MTVTNTPSAPARPSARLLIIVLGILGAIQVSDPFISTLTLVKASDELNFTASQQSLAAGISTFALAASVIPGGVLADRCGRKLILALSILVSSLGQLITAFAPAIPLYFAGRVITGVALGITFASAYGMIRDVVAEKDRGPALATFSIVNTVFPLVVLVSAGPLTAWNWRIAFVVLPIVSVIMFPIVLKLLPTVPRVAAGPVDVLGMVLIAAGVAGLLLGISSAGAGVDKPAFWGPIAIGIIALIVFGFYASTAKNPVFPVKLLAHPAFIAAVVVGIAYNFGGAALSQMSSNYWQYVTHMPTELIGIAGLPSAVAAIVSSVIAGRLVKNGVNAGVIAGVSMAVLAGAFACLAWISPTSSYAAFLPALLLSGLGGAAGAIIQGNLYLRLAPAKFFGAVTSSKTTVGQFGYSLGLTGTTVLVSMFTLSGVEHSSHGAVAGEGMWDQITSYLATGSTTNSALAAVGHDAIAQSYTNGFVWTGLIAGAFFVIAALFAWNRLHSPRAEVSAEDFLADTVLTDTKSVN